MSSQPAPGSDTRIGKILIIGFLTIVSCGVLLFWFMGQIAGLGTPYHPPSEVTATVQVHETRVAATKAIAPSLASETGVVTVLFTQLLTQSTLYAVSSV